MYDKRRSGQMRETGPCGDTAISNAEVSVAKRLYQQQLPSVTSGLSIVQELATAASEKPTPLENVGSGGRNGFNTSIAGRRVLVDRDRNEDNLSQSDKDLQFPMFGGVCSRQPFDNPQLKYLTMSRRVVNSHLEYFRKFTPFLEGRFTKDTIYEFLFFAIVENRLRMSYAKRVLRNLLSYARRYLANTRDDGGDRLVVVIEKAGSRSTTLDIRLTPESVAFFRDNPRGNVIQSKRFYQLMNSIGEQTNNERFKNVVCEARRPRELVFNKQQHSMLLEFAFRALRVFVLKYVDRLGEPFERTGRWTHEGLVQVDVTRGNSRIEQAIESLVSCEAATTTSQRQMNVERTAFEFCVAFIFGFLTGARVKSTIMRLSVAEIDGLVRGKTLEKFTKGSFARVFLPDGLTHPSIDQLHGSQEYSPLHIPYVRSNASLQLDGTTRWTFDPSDHKSVSGLLFDITLVRRDPLFYPARHICKHIGSGGECGYGTFRQCRNEQSASTMRPSVTNGSGVPKVFRQKTGVVSVGCPYDQVECGLFKDRSENESTDIETQSFFLCGGRQLDYVFDGIYRKLFEQSRPKGVFWHSQRRTYLGSVNERCGTLTASKSVGHNDVETTMLYINKSMHHRDANKRAGEAVCDELVRLMTGNMS